MTGLMVAMGAYLAADLIEDLIAPPPGGDNSNNKGGGGGGGAAGGSGTRRARAFNFSSPMKEDQERR